ncbi:hypothetical protein CVD19_05995 [Bacillus sp. T33-2]|nr:hypothetical protein CVD19_05995 [Bacillus sp. T33-2]
MTWLIIIMLFIVMLAVILVLARIKIHLDYYHGQGNDRLKIVFKAMFGLITYKIDVPKSEKADGSLSLHDNGSAHAGSSRDTTQTVSIEQMEEDLLNIFHDIKDFLACVGGMYKIVRHFLKKVEVRNLEWHTGVGAGNAAHTAILCGSFWAVKGGIMGLISNYMRLKDMPVLNVCPNFHQALSQTRLTCIFHLRLGHAIFAGIKLVKYWKGAGMHFKSKPLSHLSGDKIKSV